MATTPSSLPASALALGRAFFAFAGARAWTAISLVVVGTALYCASDLLPLRKWETAKFGELARRILETQ